MKRLFLLCTFLCACLFGQAYYTVYTDLQYDEGWGLRPSNGTDSAAHGVGAAGTWEDVHKTWTVNAWAGGWLTVATIAYPVLSNTATILTVTGTAPAGPAAYTLAGGWRGWNILGSTDTPYDLCDEYPDDAADNAVKRIILDTQDVYKVYPRFNLQLGDTGRIIRMQITNGGTPLDLTGSTILLKSWDVDNGAVRRNDINIDNMVSYHVGGWIEWRLTATDTAENNYFRLKITKAGATYYLPNEDYLYIDVINYQTVEFDDSARPFLKLKADTWTGDEVFTNPSLTGGTSWGASWDIALAGDAAVYAYNIGAGQLFQTSANFAIPVNANRWYKLTYEVTTAFAAVAAVTIPNTFAATTQTLSMLNGAHTIYFMTAAVPGNFIINVSETLVVENFTFDNLSLKEVHGRDIRMRFMYSKDVSIDMTGITSALYLAQLLAGGPVVSPFSVIGTCAIDGICAFNFSIGEFIAAGRWLIFFKFTSPSGEIVYIPSRTYLILQVV